MPISLARYINITSGVGGGSSVSTRNLGALVITGNNVCPTGTVVSFTSAANVGAYFGTGSEEYARAVFYFGFVSKTITSPSQISFYFWNNNTATGSLIYGLEATYSLSTFTAITAGDFNLTLGGYTAHVSGINLSSAGSLSAVAAAIQVAIRAVSAGGAAWTGATVTYNATTSQFNLVSGTTGVDVIAITAGTVTDLTVPLGWSTGAVLSNGTAAQSISTNLNNLLTITNNFGSFCYTTALSVTLANITAAANWNNSVSPNVQFMFSVSVTSANAVTWNASLATIGGTTLTLVSPLSTAYSEMEPMMLFAATNYAGTNSVYNYMYNQFNDNPSVTTDAFANIYDPLLINYYGQTQTAGQLINFYQRGVMCGLSTNPQAQNLYANEIWFKDAIGVNIANLLLSLPQVGANALGQSQLLGVIQPVINQGVTNGVVSVGKTLTTVQQLYITNITGSATAWRQVQTQGYWINVVIVPYVDSAGHTEYKAVYTLIYSKDDTVNLVQGSNILI